MPTVEQMQQILEPLFPGLMGVRLLTLEPDRVVAELPVRPDLCTAGGILHGGATMAFADTLGAVGTILNLPPGKRTTTTDSSTKFIGGARVDTTVVGESVALAPLRSTPSPRAFLAASAPWPSPSARAWARSLGPVSPPPGRAELHAGASTATGSAPGAASSCSTSSACRPASCSTPRSTTTAPELVAASAARGDELIGHGHTNAERQAGLSEADERALIERCRDRIARATAASRRGLALALDLGEPPARPTCSPRRASRYTPQLVPRRPAGAPAHPRRRAALVGAVSAGAERHPDDRRAARWTRRTSRRW